MTTNETSKSPTDKKTYQTTSQPATSIEPEHVIGNDPMWVIIAGSVAFAALIVMVVLFTKRFLRRQ
jgi:hypothetical protein